MTEGLGWVNFRGRGSGSVSGVVYFGVGTRAEGYKGVVFRLRDWRAERKKQETLVINAILVTTEIIAPEA